MPSQLQLPPDDVALPSSLADLKDVNWDFPSESASGPHAIHPYPARFIPQIPRALVSALSEEGERVCDPFCGSGTTLVEAALAGRAAVGIDANPIACLIARAKLSPLEDDVVARLTELERRGDELAQLLSQSKRPFHSDAARPDSEDLDFWFEPIVTEELAEIASWCRAPELDRTTRDVAQTALSSIIVRVSKQDSDTRYVRRTKGVAPGDTARHFCASLRRARNALDQVAPAMRMADASVYEASVLDEPAIGHIDAVVTSPPYPNAYSYHLYHRLRMLWLGMDSEAFKKIEIGSHRKYSSKGRNGATVETFKLEMFRVMTWLFGILKSGGYAAFVIGDSKIRGEIIDNTNVLADVGEAAGFVEAARFSRNIRGDRKAFNPTHGRIKIETILVLRAGTS